MNPAVPGSAGSGQPIAWTVTAVLVAVWGIGFGGVPVGWSSWVARAMPDQAESAGGLLVPTVQLAIAAGAAGGGLVFGLDGVRGVFAWGGALLLGAAALVGTRVRAAPVGGR